VVAATTNSIDFSTRWQLNDHVSLRDEAFGALAYHHDTRRLVFLKSVALVDVVRRLEEFATVRTRTDIRARTLCGGSGGTQSFGDHS
jgi:putative mycofactocin binding protein MftB